MSLTLLTKITAVQCSYGECFTVKDRFFYCKDYIYNFKRPHGLIFSFKKETITHGNIIIFTQEK